MTYGDGGFEDDYIPKPGLKLPTTEGKSLERYAAEARLVQARHVAQAAVARGFDSAAADRQVDKALDGLANASTALGAAEADQ